MKAKQNKFYQLNLKKMYKKAWLVEGLDAIADNIGGVNVGLHFQNLAPQYSTYIDEENGDKWFIDENISQNPEPPVTLMYLPVGGSQILESISISFTGARPSRPR